MEDGMPKSYLDDARHRAEKIKYYYDHAGEYGHRQAEWYFAELGKCYSKASTNRPHEAVVIGAMYSEAERLMTIMKQRECRN
jgi:hypothetical protein